MYELRGFLGMETLQEFACSRFRACLNKTLPPDITTIIQRMYKDRTKLPFWDDLIRACLGGRTDAESTSKLQQIPQTVVFFDSKKDTYAAMQECRNWLQESDRHKYSKKQARETIKVFH